MRIPVRLLIVSLLAAATSLRAITYIVPTDRDLVKRAEAIVIATAVESHSEFRGERLVTVATFDVERTIKGPLASSVQLVELGGTVGDRSTFIPGSPRYEAGKRYLVFLRTNQHGEWMTYGFGLGRFAIIADLRGRELVTRGGTDDEIFGLDEIGGSVHVERLRDAAVFLSFVAVRAGAGGPANDSYFVEPQDVLFGSFPEFKPRASAFVPRTLAIRPDYLSPGNYRWPSGAVASFKYCCGTQHGGTGLNGPSEASAAMSAWNGAGAGISYSLGGVDTRPVAQQEGLSKSDGVGDGVNDILMNDPHHLIGSGGVVAIGGISSAGCCYSIGDGQTYRATTEVDVETADNLPSSVDSALFTQLLTHELGHTLGFRHADGASNGPPPACQSPAPCAAIGEAIMASTIPNPNSIGSLGQWDRDAAQTVYGSYPICGLVLISTQPSSQTVAPGAQANLSVGATGPPMLLYQWYIGDSPNGTSVNGATNATFNPTMSATTHYWVRVTTTCGTNRADSNTAIVTVSSCTAPGATAPVASPASVSPGQSSTLTENATGTAPLTYQWYSGGTPIGGVTSNNFISVMPNTTTQYSVRVFGCSTQADSAATTVTVSSSCIPPSSSAPFASPSTIAIGQPSTLSVNPAGTGPFTYQWFSDGTPSNGNAIGGPTSNNFITVMPTATTQYSVRITGQCTPPFSTATTTVTVTVTCAPISGSVTATPSTINAGQTSTLSVATSGTGPFTFQWFSGTVGDTSRPIVGETSSSTIVAPVVSSSFWVRVTAPCGSRDGGVIVTVFACPTPVITTQPASISAPIGTAVTLTVLATAPGTAIHYQWYKGANGDLSTKVGTDSPTFTTRAVGVTASYWVRLTAACNNLSFTDSNAAIVTAIAAPKGRAVRH
jgi:hypothetical protein